MDQQMTKLACVPILVMLAVEAGGANRQQRAVDDALEAAQDRLFANGGTSTCWDRYGASVTIDIDITSAKHGSMGVTKVFDCAPPDVR